MSITPPPPPQVPALRFKGFTEPWHSKKLSDLYDLAGSGGTPSSAISDYYGGPIPFLGISDISGRYVRSTVKTITQAGLENSAAWIVPKGSISLAMYASVGKVAITETDLATSQAFFNMVFSDHVLRDFAYTRLSLAAMNSEWEPLISTGTQSNLNAEKIKRFTILIPAHEEQKLVSTLHKQFDFLISLNKEKYAALVQLKQAMLERMFPREGETVPELRFPGFTNPWDLYQVSDLCTFSKGSGFSKSDLRDSGIPVVLYGRLYTNYQYQISSLDTYVDPTDNAVFSSGGEVLIPSSGETAKDIAVASMLNLSGAAIGGDLNILKPGSQVDPLFLAITLSSGSPQKQLIRRAQGKSVVHLHNSDIAKTLIACPSINEQRQIRQFFQTLDERIEFQSRRVDKLKELKQALLEKMFV
ncbi:restriction endonuclease subunit S [Boudabousia marimammalium]|nr:restriction endonuclease subunit S [Boudabousia marimammalium]